MRQRLVPISKLAEFAADPEEFERRRGGVRSQAAVEAGARHHEALGQPERFWPWRVVLVVVVLVVVGMVLLGFEK